MMSLHDYMQKEDEDEAFNNALERHLESNYTEIEEGLYYCPDDCVVFEINENGIEFEGGQDGAGFYGYQSIINDSNELTDIIGRILSNK